MVVELPQNVLRIIENLQKEGFDAYAVGGCIRDIFLGKKPHDWDVCTSATPSDIKRVFSEYHTVDTGIKYGTVSVYIGDLACEVTTFRADGTYSDGRRPDEVSFESSIADDLKRRDFTINTMAYSPKTGLIDICGGKRDLDNRLIRCVGVASVRFKEDALRILRALRFASVYGFHIEDSTAKAIHQYKYMLNLVSAERIRDELSRLLLGKNAAEILLEYSDVITLVIPELAPCVDFEQNNRYHAYPVYDHIVHAVCAYTGNNKNVKFALLFHDIGKPRCYTEDGRGGHFYGHAEISADMTEKIVKRLRFSKENAEQIVSLVRIHDAQLAPTQKSVRRWLNKVGPDMIFEFIEMRKADVLAHAPGTQTERLEELNQFYSIAISEIEAKNCFSVKDLAVNGFDLMSKGVPEGKEVGRLLNKALDAVIDDVVPNKRQDLMEYLFSGT